MLVHCVDGAMPALAQAGKGKSDSSKKQQARSAADLEISYGTAKLPAPVAEMREAILAAVRSGKIEELRHAYELNELKPELAQEPVSDPVAHWKKISGDGEGLEVLAALAEILEAGYVAMPLGRDIENNRIYVWPYFAEVPLQKLTAAQQVELLRLVPPAAAKEMLQTGKYTYWRLAIGADGTWHHFHK
ncbi:MAG: hypothetical protein ABW200_19165 [Hyphomicrobiaceae bacterium]